MIWHRVNSHRINLSLWGDDLTCWNNTTFALRSNSCALRLTERPTKRMSGLSLMILLTKISMNLFSCSRMVSSEAIRWVWPRENSIPPESSIILGPLISRAIDLWLTFFRKIRPDMYAQSEIVPPGITTVLGDRYENTKTKQRSSMAMRPWIKF